MRYAPLLALSCALVLGACRAYEPHGTLLEPPLEPPPFTLVSDRGPVTSSDLHGRLTVLSFGFTACPDVCPDTMARLARAVRLLGDAADDVQVVLVSVDPERDTPEVVGRYARAFDERFLGLTGEPIPVAQVAAGFHIFAARVPLDGGGYTVDHTTSTLVLDREGRTVLIWSYGTPPEAMADDLRFLLRR